MRAEDLAAPLGRSQIVDFVIARSVQVAGDFVERIGEIVAENAHRSDDHDGDKRRDKPIFNSRRAVLFSKKSPQHKHLIASSPLLTTGENRAYGYLRLVKLSFCCSEQ